MRVREGWVKKREAMERVKVSEIDYKSNRSIDR